MDKAGVHARHADAATPGGRDALAQGLAAGALAQAGVDSGLVPGRQDVVEKQHLLIGQDIGHLQRADIGLGHPCILGQNTGIAAIQVAVAEQPGASRCRLHIENRATAGIGAFAGREQCHVAVKTLAAGNEEGNDDPVALAQLGHGRAGFKTTPMNSWSRMSPSFMAGILLR